jgi:hypothetical protein
VRSLLRRQGVLMRLHLQKLGKDETQIGEEMQKWEQRKPSGRSAGEALREQKKRQRKAKKEEAPAAAEKAAAVVAEETAPASA